MAGTDTGFPFGIQSSLILRNQSSSGGTVNCSRFNDMTPAMTMAAMRRCLNASLTPLGGVSVIAAGVLDRYQRAAMSHGPNSIVCRHKDSSVDQTAAGKFHDMNVSGAVPSSNVRVTPGDCDCSSSDEAVCSVAPRGGSIAVIFLEVEATTRVAQSLSGHPFTLCVSVPDRL